MGHFRTAKEAQPSMECRRATHGTAAQLSVLIGFRLAGLAPRGRSQIDRSPSSFSTDFSVSLLTKSAKRFKLYK
jgi:hypothetical protein